MLKTCFSWNLIYTLTWDFLNCDTSVCLCALFCQTFLENTQPPGMKSDRPRSRGTTVHHRQKQVQETNICGSFFFGWGGLFIGFSDAKTTVKKHGLHDSNSWHMNPTEMSPIRSRKTFTQFAVVCFRPHTNTHTPQTDRQRHALMRTHFDFTFFVLL